MSTHKARSKSLAVLIAPVCAMLLALMAQGALAQSSATLSVPIRVTVGGLSVSVSASQTVPQVSSELSGCTCSSTGINFGAVTGSSLKSAALAARNSVQGSLTITCPTSQLGTFGIQVGLDRGANAAALGRLHLPAGSTAARGLSNGRSLIAYDLYKPVVGAGLSFTGLAPATTLTANTVRAEWGDVAQQDDTVPCDVPGTSLGSLFCLLDENGDGLAFTLPATFLTVPYDPAPGSGEVIIPIVATIPGGQVQPLPPGVYTDTVTLTLLFF